MEPLRRKDPKYRPQVACFCSTPEREVLKDLQHMTIPDKALVRNCCYIWICTVRGRHLSLVDEENWREICRKMKYLRRRQNPRGF